VSGGEGAQGVVKVVDGADILEMSEESRAEQASLVKAIEFEFAGNATPGDRQSIARASGEKRSALPGQTVTLPIGIYRVTLTTKCHPPFDFITLGSITVAESGNPQVSVPVIPLGIFGGTCAWTSTVYNKSTGIFADQDGAADWFLINLRADTDSELPRIVQLYVDRSPAKPTVFLPARIVSATYAADTATWTIAADPAPFSGNATAEIRNRYYTRLNLDLVLKARKPVISYLGRMTDQPIERKAKVHELVLQSLVVGGSLGEPIRAIQKQDEFKTWLENRSWKGAWDYAFGLRAGIYSPKQQQ
jgi:hypothetical protein